MKQTSLIKIIILLSITWGCESKDKPQEEHLPKVKTDTIIAAENTNIRKYPGRVIAKENINLAFRVNGNIQQINVKAGEYVKQGQLLARLDPTDYRLQLNATEAEYKEIKTNAERIIALYKDSSTTASNYDKAVYGLKQITAKYQHHKELLNYTNLYAPIDGYIEKLFFEPHEIIAAGTPIVSIIGKGMPEVEINLPASEYIQRDRFKHYECSFDFYPNKQYPLRIVSTTPKANANQLYTMRLQIAENDGSLLSPGMNTTVTIFSTISEKREMIIPANALLEKDGETGVFIFSPIDNIVFLRKVEIVRPTGYGDMLITSDEVKPGEIIVSSGIHHIKNGDKVTTLPEFSKTNIGSML